MFNINGVLIIWCFNVFSLNIIWINAATNIYFTQPKVELSLPADIWKLPEPVFVLEARALLELTPTPMRNFANISYHLTDSSLPKWIYLNQQSGHLNVLPTRKSDEKGATSVVFVITARLGQAESEMTVELTLSEADFDCQTRSQDLCFWKHLKFQYYENQPIIELGTLAPTFIHIICPKLILHYKLINGNTSGLSMSHGETGAWALRTTGPADREDGNGPHRTTRIACIIGKSDRGARAEKDISIEVLDQDDNPPIPQKQNITVWLPSFQIKQGDSPDTGDLMFTDRDSPEANNYQYFIDDHFGLLNTTCQEWSVDPSRATAVHCGITFIQNTTIPDFTPYKAYVTLDNLSLISSNFSQDKPKINLIFKKIPKRYGLELFGNETIDFSHNGVIYPLTEINVSRDASKFERLVQPVERVELAALIQFRLVNSSAAFNITPRTGIVYVSNPQVLRDSKWNSSRITIEWEDVNSIKTQNINEKNISKATLIIKIIWQPSPCYKTNLKTNELCSQFSTRKECTQSCGISSSRYCQWKNQLVPKNKTVFGANYSEYYATCSPSLATCPDIFCDELELYHPYICPQDCTDFVYGSGLKSNSAGARGIKIASGTCVCSTIGKCTCFNGKKTSSSKVKTTGKPRVKPTSIGTSGTTSSPPPQELNTEARKAGVAFSECGDGCLLSVIMGSVLFLSAIVVLTFWLRRRRLHIGVRAKRKFTVRATITEDEIMRDEASGAATEETDLENKRPLSLAHIRPDPKWEFPRERLRIEQMLGEGEFGQVLRASAKDMPGIAGRLAVAVKTLKNGAGSAELNDLLSEYELLKEVSHPNVIRLLGACTLPGGPVYIIIEFAKHGSLRSYLRRSRRLEPSPAPESENPDANTSPPPPPPTPVSPRDLLSFAWQISKGMNYLSDIKLVHRDLAARNVLVASGGVCKISDFGLTRDVYEDDAYLKRSKGRVPVKWMAIESLADHMYTSKSDVWSFGILLWELVTLGSSPYPGIAVQNLFHLLRAGYRMERPENCSYPLYRLMQVCWEADPLDRPSFKDITVMLDNMLQDGADYLELSPRVVHNQGYVGAAGNSSPRSPHHESSLETDQEDNTSTEYGTLNSASDTFASSYIPMTPLTQLPSSNDITTEETTTVLQENSIQQTSSSPHQDKSDVNNKSPLHHTPASTAYQENVTPLNYLEIETGTDYNS